nr:TMV resistance protein N-like [Ipomoea batatas]
MILSGCLKLENFPKIAAPMACLLEVHAEATAIREVPPSIECLTNLRLIDVSNCKHLASLPSSICRLKGLKAVILSGCSKFENLPDELGEMECLEELYCDKTAIQELPSSISLLNNLVSLNLEQCVNLKRLPESIHFEKLETMILSGCLKLENFPEIAGPMACLLKVHAEATAIREVPPSIERLTNLRLIDVSNCKHLASLPSSICRLKGLKAVILSGCSLFEKLPDELGEMECLEELYCDKTAIQELPSSISLVKKLKILSFRGCNPLASPLQKSCSFFLSSLGFCQQEELFKISRLHNECTALKGSIGSLTKYKNLNKISFTKCDQLLEDEHNSQIMIDAMWQHLIKGLYVAHDNFAICFPGKMIPEWFTYKNWGPSILVNLPQNWYNNKFVGFALCVVSEMINTSKLEHCGYLGVKYGIDVTLSLISPDGDKSNIGSRIGFMGNKQYADSNISCLAFSSFDKYWEFYYDWAHSPNEWCQFEVSQSLIESNSTVHRGFGVRLVYEDDVKQGDEELQEVMGQSNLSHSQFGKLGLFPAVFNGFHQRQRHLNIPDLI